MLSIFTLMWALPVLLGCVVSCAACLYADLANDREARRVRLESRYLGFRVNGRTFTSAAQIRALRMALPMPTARPTVRGYLRAAPEAVTVVDRVNPCVLVHAVRSVS